MQAEADQYYETLTTMSEPCLHKARATLAWLLNNEILDEDFLIRPPLQRANASIRQPVGSNLCGWLYHDILGNGGCHEEERCCEWHCSILLVKYGQKAMQERKKTYDLACNKMMKGETVTSLQIEAMAIVNENSKLQISDLPAEYHKAIARLTQYEVGVRSRCRFQSCCLPCSIEK